MGSFWKFAYKRIVLLTKKMSIKSILGKHALFILTISAVIIGIIAGLVVRVYSFPEKSIQSRLIYFPGEIFLRGVKFIIIPLLSSSLITGIAGDSVAKTGAIARRTLFFFFLTTLIAVILATFLVTAIQPGRLNRDRLNEQQTKNNSSASSVSQAPKLSTLDTLMDLIRNMMPDNVVEMCFQVYRSKVETQIITGMISGFMNSHFKMMFLL